MSNSSPTFGSLLRIILDNAVASDQGIRLKGLKQEKQAIALRHRLYRLREVEKGKLEQAARKMLASYAKLHDMPDAKDIEPVEHPWDVLRIFIESEDDGTFSLHLSRDDVYYKDLTIVDAKTGELMGLVGKEISAWIGQQPGPTNPAKEDPFS